MQDRLHQPAVVLHHRALTGHEHMRLREAEAEAHRQRTFLRRLIGRARITRDVEPGNAEAAAGPSDVHERVEHRRRSLRRGILAVPSSLEADRVDSAVDLGHTEDLLDLILRVALRHIDRLAAEAARLGEPILVEIADDDTGRSEQMRRGGRGDSDGTCTGDVDRRTHTDPGADRTVEPGGEDVREHREVEDLLHRLVLVRELQEVPIGVGHEHILGLTADPTAHIDIPVGRARTIGIDVEADAGLAFPAVPAATAGDVERHRDEVADLDELDIATDFDDLTGDLVTEDEALRGSRTAPDHVLVGAADVRCHCLEDDAVIDLAADIGGIDSGPVLEDEFRVFGVDDFDFSGTGVADCLIAHR